MDASPSTTVAPERPLSRLHVLLAVQSIVVVAVSINRLGTWTRGYVAPNEFLRWVDLHNMLTLPLVSIVAFNDDEFSHWVFFVGFVLVSASLMALQALFPRRVVPGARDLALLVANGVAIGAGVFANLAFERTGLDLYVVALLALAAFVLLRRLGRQPLLVYYATAYGLGLVGTALYKGLR